MAVVPRKHMKHQPTRGTRWLRRSSVALGVLLGVFFAVGVFGAPTSVTAEAQSTVPCDLPPFSAVGDATPLAGIHRLVTGAQIARSRAQIAIYQEFLRAQKGN